MSTYDDAMRDSGRLAEMSYGHRLIETAELWRAVDQRDYHALSKFLFPEAQQLSRRPPAQEASQQAAGLGTAGAGDSEEPG